MLSLMGHENAVPELFCDDESLPNFPYPETAARVLAHMFHYHVWCSQPQGEVLDFPDVDPQSVRAICDLALTERKTAWLDVVDTQQVLKAFGLRYPPFRVAQTWAETESVAQQLGYPVVLKLSSSEVLRKTDRAGVFLNLHSPEDLREAFDSLQFLKKHLEQPESATVMVQKMMPLGLEIQCGLSEEALFGPVLRFGLGGVHSEVLHDHTFRLTPITHLEARNMVQSIRGYRLLQGYDGSEPADIDAVETLLMRLSLLAETVPQICEIDCNPIMAYRAGEGVSVLDCRIRVREVEPFQPRRFSFHNTRSIP